MKCWTTAHVLAVISLLFAAATRADAAAAPPTSVPPAVAEMHGFRGRIDYTARRDDSPAPAIVGTLVVGAETWSLDERSGTYDLRAGSRGSELVSGSSRVVVDDVLNADPLTNAWAAALGTFATQPLEPSDRAGMWSTADEHLFVDPTGARVIGFSEPADTELAFSVDDWTRVGPIDLPHKILRLRDGVPDASYTIADYRVTPMIPAPSSVQVPFAPVVRSRTISAASVVVPFVANIDRADDSAMVVAIILLLCLGVVAWTRRDALLLGWCRWIARDPRGWRHAGVSVFVEPDGVLTFDRSRYRVGPHFYSRAALVQASALFVRVTSPAVSFAVILPRKFRPVDLGIRQSPSRKSATGFTLIETILATALFAAVVLLAIYPAMGAIAHADAMAAERSEAVVLASNALADEEAVADYDGGAPEGAATTHVDGLTLTVTVSPGTIRDESDLDVHVTDVGGTVLAHVTSWLGVPVKSPPNSGGGPP